MDCSKCRENLHGYAKKSLDIANSIAVSKHLDGCEDCRQELDEILRLKEISRAFNYSSALQKELKSSIMASIDLGRYKPPRKKNTNEMVKWGISMVAAGLVMMVLNSVPLSLNDTQLQTGEGKLIQTFGSFGKGFTNMSERLIQLDGITERLQKQYKGGI